MNHLEKFMALPPKTVVKAKRVDPHSPLPIGPYLYFITTGGENAVVTQNSIEEHGLKLDEPSNWYPWDTNLYSDFKVVHNYSVNDERYIVPNNLWDRTDEAKNIL